MILLNNTEPKESLVENQSWPWWPLLPLYPYGRKRTTFKEIVPGQVWSFEQLQGLYYVAVPVRLTVLKVSGGLILVNPLPPTYELKSALIDLEKLYGPILSIVLPTASGLEHKIFMPALARAFPNAELWVCPGQWSFPIPLPLSWLGFPASRTKTLGIDGLPHEDSCEWIPLGPIDIGLGRFQEFSCFHKKTGSLLVTDALVGIESDPPALFDLDPTPLLFHARENGSEPLDDSPELRKKGWARLVLFASFLRPAELSIPSLKEVFKNAFKPGLRNPRAHFGIYPFAWQKGWDKSARELIGNKRPLVQIAPVLERLVFPRAKSSLIVWLEKLIAIRGIRRLISAHFTAPISFSSDDLRRLKRNIDRREWAPVEGNWKFLGFLDTSLLKGGVVPKDPLKEFKD